MGFAPAAEHLIEVLDRPRQGEARPDSFSETGRPAKQQFLPKSLRARPWCAPVSKEGAPRFSLTLEARS
jgi:hypothetical protein